MAPIPGLTETVIRNHAAPESYSRGQSYYRRDAVTNLTQRGSQIQALVAGSQYSPYRVRVSFDQGGVTEASCSCPYDWGGWCKHIVAALLACLHAPDAIAERQPLDAQLGQLDRAQLQSLLLALAERDPDLADTIERQVGLLRLANLPRPASPAAQARRPPIDQEAIRQQVRSIVQPRQRGRYNSYDDEYYDDEDPGGETVAAFRPLLAQVRSLLDGGDAHTALDILAALTGEYLIGCQEIESQLDEMYGISLDETSHDELFTELAELWAEAILSANMPADERDEWGEQIAGLRDEADEFGLGATFDIAVAAAEQGWDYPPLQQALAAADDDGESGEIMPAMGDQLTQIRLRVLERQGRSEDYLRLAKAAGQILQYVLMLTQVGRTAEATDAGIAYLSRAEDALALAKALREQGELEDAWKIAEHGVALEPLLSINGYADRTDMHQRAELAEWAVELAAGLGRPEPAQRMAEIAFALRPSLQGYLRAQDLAGPAWPAMRDRLLDELRQSSDTATKVGIFLHEQLIDDAIEAVEQGSGYGLLEQVADAAVATRPAWAAAVTTAQAQRIMASGDAQRYEQAVGWLRCAREAFRAQGRSDEWQKYLADIRAQYKRKYKLMGLLDTL